MVSGYSFWDSNGGDLPTLVNLCFSPVVYYGFQFIDVTVSVPLFGPSV